MDLRMHHTSVEEEEEEEKSLSLMEKTKGFLNGGHVIVTIVIIILPLYTLNTCMYVCPSVTVINSLKSQVINFYKTIISTHFTQKFLPRQQFSFFFFQNSVEQTLIVKDPIPE